MEIRNNQQISNIRKSNNNPHVASNHPRDEAKKYRNASIRWKENKIIEGIAKIRTVILEDERMDS